jgi:hypothetical protein
MHFSRGLIWRKMVAHVHDLVMTLLRQNDDKWLRPAAMQRGHGRGVRVSILMYKHWCE